MSRDQQKQSKMCFQNFFVLFDFSTKNRRYFHSSNLIFNFSQIFPAIVRFKRRLYFPNSMENDWGVWHPSKSIRAQKILNGPDRKICGPIRTTGPFQKRTFATKFNLSCTSGRGSQSPTPSASVTLTSRVNHSRPHARVTDSISDSSTGSAACMWARYVTIGAKQLPLFFLK